MRPVAWLAPGANVDVQVPTALDRCDPAAFGGGGKPGFGFETESATAATYGVSLEGLGATLRTRSGYDSSTKIIYKFGRSRSHVLCGPDGRQPAVEADRIFAGVPNT